MSTYFLYDLQHWQPTRNVRSCTLIWEERFDFFDMIQVSEMFTYTIYNTKYVLLMNL